MKIVTLSNQIINNPIYTKLAAKAHTEPYRGNEQVSQCELFVFDAVSVPHDEVNQAIAFLDAGVSVLFLDPTDEHKKALAKRIGFRSHGAGRGYLAVKANDQDGREYYRIIEAKDNQTSVSLTSQVLEWDASGVKKETDSQVSLQDVAQAHLLSDAQVDLFISSLALAPQEVTANSASTTTPPSALVWQNWIYSRVHTVTASGQEYDGLGPPPTNTHIALSLNYQFSAALNNTPQSGAFQYLGLGLSGIFQNGGMSSSSDTAAGWILTQIAPEFQIPESEFFWYSSSPSNTNNVTQVTTGSSVSVGFDASVDRSGPSVGANGSYTYSNSTTKDITDWYIKQLERSKWLYAQNTPFDGASNDWSGGFNSFSGTVQHSYLPTISTSSLQFAVNAVWKTNTVLTTEATVTCYNPMMVGYLMANKFMGLSTKGVSWTAYSNPMDTFSINMAVVSSPV